MLYNSVDRSKFYNRYEIAVVKTPESGKFSQRRGLLQRRLSGGERAMLIF